MRKMRLSCDADNVVSFPKNYVIRNKLEVCVIIIL